MRVLFPRTSLNLEMRAPVGEILEVVIKKKSNAVMDFVRGRKVGRLGGVLMCAYDLETNWLDKRHVLRRLLMCAHDKPIGLTKVSYI
jgi:hypothetical protein